MAEKKPAVKTESAAEKLNRLLDEKVARVEMVPLGQIWESAEKYQSRERTDDDHVRAVMGWMAVTESTRGQEFVAPIVLFEDPDGDIVVAGKAYKYRLSDGFHRVRAASFLKWDKIPAIIIPGGDAECLEFAVSANLGSTSKPVTDVDKRKSVYMMLTNPHHNTKNLSKISELCGCCYQVAVSEYRKIKEDPEKCMLLSSYYINSKGCKVPFEKTRGSDPRIVRGTDGLYYSYFKSKRLRSRKKDESEARLDILEKIKEYQRLLLSRIDLSKPNDKIVSRMASAGVYAEVVSNSSAIGVILSDGHAIGIAKESGSVHVKSAMLDALVFTSFGDSLNSGSLKPAIFVSDKSKMNSYNALANKLGIRAFTPEEFIKEYREKRGMPTSVEEILGELAANGESEPQQVEAA